MAKSSKSGNTKQPVEVQNLRTSKKNLTVKEMEKVKGGAAVKAGWDVGQNRKI